MGELRISRIGRGLVLEFKDKKYAIDDVSIGSFDYHFISHAHWDHLPKRICGKILASEETLRFAVERGMRMVKVDRSPSHAELLNSGHILGSSALLIDDKILYTGDVCLRDRFFLRGFKPIKVEILIIEATYGKSNYLFGDIGRIIDESFKYLLNALATGKNVVVTGYPLGKGQILTKLLNWFDNLIVHDEVERFNKLYSEFGIDLGEYMPYQVANKRNYLKKGGWILIAPKGPLAKKIARKNNALM
ncbi:hypothetical protein DRN86_02170, partial [Candidatus Geothermarchaeota archaeon]